MTGSEVPRRRGPGWSDSPTGFPPSREPCGWSPRPMAGRSSQPVFPCASRSRRAILRVVPVPLIEFPADDPERARRFWSGVLGAGLEPRPADAGEGWEANGADLRLGVHERGPGPGDTASLAYFTVPDLPGALQR